MIKNKASWVALSVLAIATALMVFVVQPNLRDQEKEQAGQPATSAGEPAEPSSGAKVASAPSAKEGADGRQTAAPPKPVNPAQSAHEPIANWTVPGFDVLRVEPDGSTVIAGRAQPGTTLEILSGDTVLGTTDVGPAGDFAAVFDKPLAAGDYQLTLRSVGPGGAAKTSEEVATVSVPKDASGQLLAMVSKPGEASRLITTPKGKAKPMQAAVEPISPATGEPGGASTTSAQPAAIPGLQVTAVEIEGRTMFVAGNAKPGVLVRIYADDKLLGEMKTDEKGHFVVDGSIDLAVGSHIIRADMLNEDASKVAMRASVPFDRPAGAQIAAVAGSSSTVVTTGLDGLKTEAGKALALLKGLFANGKQPTAEQLAAARSATEFALKSLAEFKPAEASNQAQATAAAEASKAAAKALTILKSSPQDSASVATALDKVAGVVGPALARQGGSASVATSAELHATPGTETANAAEPSTVGDAESALSEPTTEQAAASASAEGQPTTIEQAPLKESKTSVIIRRGDTLWQISRRVYGAGVRYTTIYVANREQIDNPDMIQPGQVFGVPDKALSDEESREIHRKRVKRGE
ncbi:LysM peptidoglycan-binding domain-containing protein [Sinorhizobium numidicum]|uniref:LysM peptidoglycan-binding domain-containing protein n=1 Tax=Sinorhizobium numidicum TaxID=680248 RepID=A0ABY8CTF2_9HYPH|nr:LysM peptidoglycan-binding domain-containing protein [Sinorhizobium numidicum]WEX78467.1 LysM peptidoglycan-binding domain-containing protein [Sinorhizobium numidicum]WEX81864.1 LysM peptidoglycan-binding domain-containing protein [Sinorhizobium numidicum]